MAKKGQAVQLQQELNSDDDWDKMLQRDGLIVIDIFSEWCGPCSAMTANLKKLKLEVGGDNLQLAIAKSDKISYLQRFRNKSEPTWMFIVDGKMVNLMFGANAPKLVRLITKELQNEAAVKEGTRERVTIEISELAEEERVRYEAAKKIEDETIRIETERREQVLRDKRLAVTKVVLDNVPPFGVILVFPRAKDRVQSLLSDLWALSGLAISTTEKPIVTEAMIEEMLYFSNMEFSKIDVESLTSVQTLAYLIKPVSGDDFSGDIDELVLELIYGASKCAPGDPETPAQLLMTRGTKAELQAKPLGSKLHSKVVPKAPVVVDEDKKEEEEEILEISGVWAPPNALTKATAIKLLFPKIYDPIAVPEPTPVPPHVAIAYEAFKRKEIVDLATEYREDVIRYGFFTDDNPETATLIAKTLPAFEKIYGAGSTYSERLVVQLAKKRSEVLCAFVDLGPTFMSQNTVIGEGHCKLFFPSGYDVPDVAEKVLVKKKRRRGRKAKEIATPAQGAAAEGEPEVVDEAGAAEEEAEGEQGDGEGEGDGESEGEVEGDGEEQVVNEDGAEAAGDVDKATSPMPEEGAA